MQLPAIVTLNCIIHKPEIQIIKKYTVEKRKKDNSFVLESLMSNENEGG